MAKNKIVVVLSANGIIDRELVRDLTLTYLEISTTITSSFNNIIGCSTGMKDELKRVTIPFIVR